MFNLNQHKWKIYWTAFIILTTVFIVVAIDYQDSPGIGNTIQTLATVLALYITVLIFLQSKEESEKQFRTQLEHLQSLNATHLEALHKATERQIDALKESTSKEIAAFEKQTNEIALRLSDNSILLAEILGRELEKSIDMVEAGLKKEQHKYKDLTGWKLLRTPEERKAQLDIQGGRLKKVKKLYEYLVEKYKQIRTYLGSDPLLLEE